MVRFTTVALSTTTVAGWTVPVVVLGNSDDDDGGGVVVRRDIPNPRGKLNVGPTNGLVVDLDDFFLEDTGWVLFGT